MSKASFAYQKLYGDSLKETAVGDYIKELEADIHEERNISRSYAEDVINYRLRIAKLEAEKAELIDFIKDLYFSELNDNDTTELTTRQVICLTTLYKKHVRE